MYVYISMYIYIYIYTHIHIQPGTKAGQARGESLVWRYFFQRRCSSKAACGWMIMIVINIIALIKQMLNTNSNDNENDDNDNNIELIHVANCADP